MSEQNLALARRWIELYNDRSDVAEFLSLLAPDVEMRTPRGARLRGLEEARTWFEESPDNVRPRIIADRLVGRRDTVVGLGRSEMRWIESGEIAYESESAAVFQFRDGKLVTWQPFESHSAALEAAGLLGSKRARQTGAVGGRCHSRAHGAVAPTRSQRSKADRQRGPKRHSGRAEEPDRRLVAAIGRR